jgi:hypothetical protein
MMRQSVGLIAPRGKRDHGAIAGSDGVGNKRGEASV